MSQAIPHKSSRTMSSSIEDLAISYLQINNESADLYIKPFLNYHSIHGGTNQMNFYNLL